LPGKVDYLEKDKFHITGVDASNAHLVGTIFRSIYGEDFHVKDVYEPDVLCREIQEGRLFSGLATDWKGEAAGYICLFKSAPNPNLWEAGNIVVVPEHTHTDISGYLVRYCVDFIRHPLINIDGVFGEAVCSHYFTQIVMAKTGMVDCGIELDLLDGGSFKDGKSNKAATARVSCVLNFLENNDLKGPEYVPVRYEEILRRIEARCA
jgi:hypothetical protein